MKTTIEISASLLDEAKKLAAKEGTTVRASVEQGLKRIVAERKKSRKLFRLRKAAFKGNGLQSGVQDATWDRIRESIYQGRGG
jgi:peptidyl-tRNA hydrolase